MSVRGGVPPQNLEAERSVLGAILVQNDVIDRVREIGLEARDFYLDAHQKIFDCACQLADSRRPVDLVTLSDFLRSKAWFDQVGGTSALTSLFEESFAVGNATHYAGIVRDKAIHRRMIEACGEIVGEALEGVTDTEGFLDSAETKIFGVAESRSQSTMVSVKSVVMKVVAQIEDLAMNNRDVTGLPTGFHDFDRITTGMHPGQVLVVAARPGMGKTSWILSVIQHAAVQPDAVVLMFSLEMSAEDLTFRMLSGMSKIDSRKLKTGKVSERDFSRLAQVADQVSRMRMEIDDSGGIGVMDIRARARRLLAREKKLSLIVIDYLQLMRGSKAASKGDFSREREISEISRGLKELSKELKVPIVALSQLNRGVEQRQDKRPVLSDLRESGAIEQDADMVVFIHREDYYDKETENKGIAELIIAKNRNGETQTVRLAWLGQYTLFANLADEHVSPGPPTPFRPPRPDKGDVYL